MVTYGYARVSSADQNEARQIAALTDAADRARGRHARHPVARPFSQNGVCEVEGLVVALRRFGLKRGVIVTHAQRDEAVSEDCEIDIVPAFEYLCQ